MAPEWREVLTFDIQKATDRVVIQIINNFNNQMDILAEKEFTLGEIGQDTEDPLHELSTQKRIDDILLISNQEEITIGQIAYQATWVYNKGLFFNDLLVQMKTEREDLIGEVRHQHKKLNMIAKPFGGYINIIDVDDIHFEDEMMPSGIKKTLAVSEFEEKLNQQFNMVGGSLGLRETRWGRAAILLFAIWTVFTALVCFGKPDYLNVSTYNWLIVLVNRRPSWFVYVPRPSTNQVIVHESTRILLTLVGDS